MGIASNVMNIKLSFVSHAHGALPYDKSSQKGNNDGIDDDRRAPTIRQEVLPNFQDAICKCLQPTERGKNVMNAL